MFWGMILGDNLSFREKKINSRADFGFVCLEISNKHRMNNFENLGRLLYLFS